MLLERRKMFRNNKGFIATIGLYPYLTLFIIIVMILFGVLFIGGYASGGIVAQIKSDQLVYGDISLVEDYVNLKLDCDYLVEICDEASLACKGIGKECRTNQYISTNLYMSDIISLNLRNEGKYEQLVYYLTDEYLKNKFKLLKGSPDKFVIVSIGDKVVSRDVTIVRSIVSEHERPILGNVRNFRDFETQLFYVNEVGEALSIPIKFRVYDFLVKDVDLSKIQGAKDV